MTNINLRAQVIEILIELDILKAPNLMTDAVKPCLSTKVRKFLYPLESIGGPSEEESVPG